MNHHIMMGSSTADEEVGKKDEAKRSRSCLLGISDLSDDLIGKMIFKFVGRGHFLFVAGTSRHFYQVYETICKDGGDNTNDCRTTTTTMKSAVESISRSEL